jgi:hypothetical protein
LTASADGAADGQIKLLGQGLQVSDIVTGMTNLGFAINAVASSRLDQSRVLI